MYLCMYICMYVCIHVFFFQVRGLFEPFGQYVELPLPFRFFNMFFLLHEL